MKRLATPVFALVLILYVAFACWAFRGSSPSEATTRGVIGDSFGILNALFSSLGFAGVLTALFLQHKESVAQAMKNHGEVEDRQLEVAERRSLFNLESSIKAFDKASELLSDGNNDRVTWIRAGRILKHSQQFMEGVTVDSHKLALELRLLDYRGSFQDILKNKPAAFFYGVNPYDIPTDEAARQSSREDPAAPDDHSRGAQYLGESSIRAVWEASQWPENYSDPLDDSTFTESEKSGLLFPQGVLDYLNHLEQWGSIAGALYPRRRQAAR